jgi:hypothetical protein
MLPGGPLKDGDEEGEADEPEHQERSREDRAPVERDLVVLLPARLLPAHRRSVLLSRCEAEDFPVEGKEVELAVEVLPE